MRRDPTVQEFFCSSQLTAKESPSLSVKQSQAMPRIPKPTLASKFHSSLCLYFATQGLYMSFVHFSPLCQYPNPTQSLHLYTLASFKHRIMHEQPAQSHKPVRLEGFLTWVNDLPSLPKFSLLNSLWCCALLSYTTLYTNQPSWFLYERFFLYSW